ncbi:hypothetical protein F0310_05025 (plasmid) [Borrelia sp. A-FGy1]|uniref:hypothetical protein n=1 Tax=Borrelia sp. A-FGy1 TaxID=2608247 RepID=UPI0015F55F0C|nr:hypothetical protein [Borrelia sp. A-FGy1]QMU99780.1 hypothetical protein F0310_05025 [Borrelia sp. A-FGy1]
MQKLQDSIYSDFIEYLWKDGIDILINRNKILIYENFYYLLKVYKSVYTKTFLLGICILEQRYRKDRVL